MKFISGIFSILLIAIFITTTNAKAGVEEGIDIRRVQTILTELCYNPGPIDGAWGRKTEAAVKAFFSRYNRMYRGTFDENDENFVLTVGNGATPRGLVACTPVNKESGNEKVQSFENIKVNVSGEITKFDGYPFELPENISYQPNDATIAYYYLKNNSKLIEKNGNYKIYPIQNAKPFRKKIEKNSFIVQELNTKTIFSYLYFENGEIIYDEVAPAERYGIAFGEDSYFSSHSVGKSITSYLVGHAICEGYIESINSKISNWEMMSTTLYFNQPIIQLLNMKSGDYSVLEDQGTFFKYTGRHIHNKEPLIHAVRTEGELKNTKTIKNPKYYYSNMTSDILFNYVMHKTGSKFETFIKNFYQNKVKIQNPVYLEMNRIGDDPHANPPLKLRVLNGAGRYGIAATRYDYLRIAKLMMDDWQQDTCEGRYLKEVYKRRVSRNTKVSSWSAGELRWGLPTFGHTARKWAGHFLTEISGLDRQTVLVMKGNNGQSIAIDMDNSRIIIINAGKDRHFNTYKLGVEPLKYGRIR